MSTTDLDLANKGVTAPDVLTDKVDYVESNADPPHQGLQRQLKNRHVAMIRYLQLFFLDSYFR